MEFEVQTAKKNEVIAEDYKGKALEYLTSMGNKLPAKQQTQFIELAQALKLNPFKREIYAVGYGENWNIITGYEVYIKRAERTGLLDGWDVAINGSGENMTATITIYRKDFSHPFQHTVLFSEVCQKTKEGKLNSVWGKMPSFMCKKVAIAQGFRLCFCDELAGMPYTSDELPDVDSMKSAEIPAEEVISAPAPKKSKEKDNTLLEIKKILEESKYDDGTLIFNEEDKAFMRNYIKHNSAEDALKVVIEERNNRYNNPKE